MTPERAHLSKLLTMGNIEIRAFSDTTWVGNIDSLEPLLKSIGFCMKKGMNIYNTFNPTSLPVTNDVKPNRKGSRDTDILTIQWLPFDIDVRNKTEAGASDEQIDCAHEVSQNIIEYLDEHGWGEPFIGFSGNGWHLNYRTDLPNDSETKKMLKTIYKNMHARFSNENVVFDQVVYNASRILRTYGTVNHKGGRKSFCCSDDTNLVTASMIRSIHDEIKPPEPTRRWVKKESEQVSKYIKNWDIVGAFSRAGMYLQQRGEVHDVICPWSESHSSHSESDAGIWEGEWPQFHCFHSGCCERTILDVLTYFESNYGKAD
ncbi:MAG: hypothetical protein PF495_10045 [Spirochaetales bacterium]|nr:hypothetical protein [Spirochaetales bacterium]